MTHHDESLIMTHPIDDSYLVHFSSVLFQSVFVVFNTIDLTSLYDVIGYDIIGYDVIGYDVIVTTIRLDI